MGLSNVGGSVSTQYRSLIPILKSVSQSGYRVSASSIYSQQSADDVVICFDGKTDDATWELTGVAREKIFIGASMSNQSITIELPTPKEVHMAVVIYPVTVAYGVGGAKTLSVSGSNDGAVYTPLNGTAATPWVFVRNQADSARYKYYRLDMTRAYEYIGVIEIMLFGQ